MKTKLLALAPLCLYGASAWAQSSLTLYGVLDEGVMFNSNVAAGPSQAGHKWYLDSLNGMYGSRWGMKGAEDLGGGMRAIFTLESGVNLNTGAAGQGGLQFGRQAAVGLSNQRFGDLTLGRQYDSVVNYAQAVTIQGYLASQVFQHPGDFDNTAKSVRTNNAIRYASPNINGLTFGGTWSVGGQPGNISGNGGYSAGAAYSNGVATLAAAYLYFKNPTAATAGQGFFTSNGSGTQLTGILNKAYASANSYQVAVAGGLYTIGPVQIGASWSSIEYGNIVGLGGASARFNSVDAGVKWSVTPAFSLGAAYDYAKGNNLRTSDGANVGNQHFNQFSMMADYFLSKRTDLYAEGAYQIAAGTSSTGAPAVANIGNAGDSSNTRQALVRAAIRHRF